MMSAFASRAMRNNRWRWSLVLLGALAVTRLGANEPADSSADIAPARVVDHAEYHSQSLPNDIFVPTEGVVEDYPVAFPVDI